MAELGEGAEAEHAAGAFQGVELAPGLGGGVGVAPDGGAQPDEPLESPAHLPDEERDQVREIGFHATRLLARRAAGAMGGAVAKWPTADGRQQEQRLRCSRAKEGCELSAASRFSSSCVR